MEGNITITSKILHTVLVALLLNLKDYNANQILVYLKYKNNRMQSNS